MRKMLITRFFLYNEHHSANFAYVSCYCKTKSKKRGHMSNGNHYDRSQYERGQEKASATKEYPSDRQYTGRCSHLGRRLRVYISAWKRQTRLGA